MKNNQGFIQRSGIFELIYITHSWPVFIVYLVLAAMFILLMFINSSFPSVFAFTNLFSSASPLIFAAFAQTAVVIIKGIDLSVGSVMSLTMVIAARLMNDSPVSIAAVITLCMLVGLTAGFLNGMLVAFGRIQAIIVSLATSSIFSGIALYVMPQPGGYIPSGLNVISMGALFDIIPISGLVLAAVYICLWIPLRKSKIGKSWFAIGGNESGAYFSGIDVNIAKLTAFMASGLFSALGGLMLAFQTLTGDSMIGNTFTLNSIASIVLGGTALAGGRGSALGAIGGALVLTVMVDILFFFEVSSYYQYVFSGIILILTLAIAAGYEYFRKLQKGGLSASAKGGK